MRNAHRAVLHIVLSALLAPFGLSRAQASHEHAEPATEAVLGEIAFPTSAAPAAHAAFIRGVLYLHNFHYPRAAKEFRAAQQADPGDVMAYWGEAMTYTHPVWNQQDTALAHAALARLAPTREARLAKARTARERAWLDAVEALYASDGGTKARRDSSYSAAMAKLHADNPRDAEAATFYALSLLGLNQGERESVAYAHAYAIADTVFRAHPKHPGAAHYVIHAVDDPEHATLGLSAARAYSAIAPTAAHALHMTSHIFVARGMWDDDVRANLQAQAAMPQLSGHAVQWLVYGLLQQGRPNEAARWVDSLATQARGGTGLARSDAWQGLAAIIPAYLADSHRWSDARAEIALDTMELGFDERSTIDFGRALAALGRGRTAAADSLLSGMAARRAREAPSLSERFDRAVPVAQVEAARSVVRERTIRALIRAAARDTLGAVALLDSASAQEALLPTAFGPPVTIKPPAEVAGELLLSARQPAAARVELDRALARTPGRPAVLLGLARAEKALGHSAGAKRRYRQLAQIWRQAESGLADADEARAAVGAAKR